MMRLSRWQRGGEGRGVGSKPPRSCGSGGRGMRTNELQQLHARTNVRFYVTEKMVDLKARKKASKKKKKKKS